MGNQKSDLDFKKKKKQTGRYTLNEIHMVYENEIIPDEGELNTFLDVPTSYSLLPENTTPYTKSGKWVGLEWA